MFLGLNAIVIVALVLGAAVIVDTVVFPMLDAWAQKPRGCNTSVAANASEGRCVEPGKP